MLLKKCRQVTCRQHRFRWEWFGRWEVWRKIRKIFDWDIDHWRQCMVFVWTTGRNDWWIEKKQQKKYFLSRRSRDAPHWPKTLTNTKTNGPMRNSINASVERMKLWSRLRSFEMWFVIKICGPTICSYSKFRSSIENPHNNISPILFQNVWIRKETRHQERRPR